MLMLMLMFFFTLHLHYTWPASIALPHRWCCWCILISSLQYCSAIARLSTISADSWLSGRRFTPWLSEISCRRCQSHHREWPAPRLAPQRLLSAKWSPRLKRSSLTLYFRRSHLPRWLPLSFLAASSFLAPLFFRYRLWMAPGLTVVLKFLGRKRSSAWSASLCYMLLVAHQGCCISCVALRL